MMSMGHSKHLDRHVCVPSFISKWKTTNVSTLYLGSRTANLFSWLPPDSALSCNMYKTTTVWHNHTHLPLCVLLGFFFLNYLVIANSNPFDSSSLSHDQSFSLGLPAMSPSSSSWGLRLTHFLMTGWKVLSWQDEDFPVTPLKSPECV